MQPTGRWFAPAVVVALALATMLATTTTADAQAFGLNEIGTCPVGRTSAGTAAPCTDGSAIFWNPAATTRLTGTILTIGGAAISVNGSFTADTTGLRYPGDAPIEYPPYAFVNRKVGARAAVGLGVYVPYGLTSQWKDDFPGRFSALKASLQTVYVQPNVAFELIPGRLSVGGGPVFGYSRVELQQGVDLSEQVAAAAPVRITFAQLGIPRGTEFARARLEGSTTAWGFQVGRGRRSPPGCR
jgi:long-chain fatty acid transport protein